MQHKVKLADAGQRAVGGKSVTQVLQIQGMGETSACGPNRPHTTGLGDPGSYLFGKGAGQQGTEMGFGFAPPAFGNQGLGQATASGAATGAPGLWASPTRALE